MSVDDDKSLRVSKYVSSFIPYAKMAMWSILAWRKASQSRPQETGRWEIEKYEENRICYKWPIGRDGTSCNDSMSGWHDEQEILLHARNQRMPRNTQPRDKQFCIHVPELTTCGVGALNHWSDWKTFWTSWWGKGIGDSRNAQNEVGGTSETIGIKAIKPRY